MRNKLKSKIKGKWIRQDKWISQVKWDLLLKSITKIFNCEKVTTLISKKLSFQYKRMNLYILIFSL